MKECCDVLYYNYVDPASIYRSDPDLSQIPIHWIQLDPDPTRIHQIHWISGRIRIWIRCTPTSCCQINMLLEHMAKCAVTWDNLG